MVTLEISSGKSECPVCSGNSFQIWGRSSGFLLKACTQCSHHFADMESRQIDFAAGDLFREFITNGQLQTDTEYYAHLCSGELPGHPTAVTAEHILKLCKKMPVHGKRWLDIGPGSGFLLQQVKNLGWECVGVEPGGWGQLAAHEKNLNIVHGILSRETFDTQFDVISATDVLEHQTDPLHFMFLLHHYLKPEGIAILSFPCADSLAFKMRGQKWSMVAPPTHCQFFTRESATMLFQQTGFTVIEMKQHNVLNLKGACKYSFVRKIADILINLFGGGDQLVAILQPQPVTLVE